MCGLAPSPLMTLTQEDCGPANAIYFAMDEPELFAEVLELMQQHRVRALRAIMPHLQADTVWMTENTSTTLINPTMFEEICMPHLRDYADIIHEHGALAIHHMCGKLDALLELIDQLPADANEAYTTPPVGDTTLTAGRTRMPSKCLIGGTNAAQWLRPADDILAEVAADLATCPNRRGIFLTSAGVLPAAVSMDKAKRVVAGFKSL
jgi:uroporphyrinogen-III decarboxylase